MTDSRILWLISLLTGSIFLICFAVQEFIYERLDPNGVPGEKENRMRWEQYANEVRIYKVVGMLFLLLAISSAILAVVARRRRDIVN